VAHFSLLGHSGFNAPVCAVLIQGQDRDVLVFLHQGASSGDLYSLLVA
jgi:hypothetical protein